MKLEQLRKIYMDRYRHCCQMMYPQGSADLPPKQVADVARMFSMGWIECLSELVKIPTNSDTKHVLADMGMQSLLVTEPLTNREFVPTPEWHWQPKQNNN
jgi:hypothetical protein